MKKYCAILSAIFLGLVRLSAAGEKGTKQDVLAAYFTISTALAADNLADAKSAARGLAEQAKTSENPEISASAQAIAKAKKIEDARGSFKTLSTAIEPLAAGEKGCIVMYCPMAQSDWVQNSSKVQNPYFGKAMLTCGGPKEGK